MLKRILTLLLVSAMLLACVSCGQISISEKEDHEDQTTDERSSADAAEEKEEDYEVQTDEKKKPSGKSESEYVEEKIEEAESVFTNYTKYQDALSVIRSALQKYPDNKSLLQKRDYYQSFAPVFLSDIEPYTKSQWYESYGSIEDVFGNTQNNCIRIERNFQTADGTYDLKRAYNTLSMTIFGLGDGENGMIKIYADGVCIYSNLEIDVNTRPFEVELDITGVLDLKIAMYQEYRSYTGECFALSNVKVQRTEK